MGMIGNKGCTKYVVGGLIALIATKKSHNPFLLRVSVLKKERHIDRLTS
jgi:hypothetical protein